MTDKSKELKQLENWLAILVCTYHKHPSEGLAKVIKYEQQNLCDITGIKQVESIIGLPIKGLQRQFNHWINLRLKAH